MLVGTDVAPLTFDSCNIPFPYYPWNLPPTLYPVERVVIQTNIADSIRILELEQEVRELKKMVESLTKKKKRKK